MSVRAHNGPASFAMAVPGLRSPSAKPAVTSQRIKCRGQYPMVAKDAATGWAQLVRKGVFKGHWSGREFDITDKVMASFIRNFNAQANAIPLEYGHSNSEGDAAGWIHELELRADGWLYGFCEFTEECVTKVRAGKLKFTSIDFAMEVPHRETGEPQGPTLFAAGVLNRPFIDGQQPLSL